MAKLGYRVVGKATPVENAEPDLRIVDERDAVAPEKGADTGHPRPVILITGPAPGEFRDPNVVGWVQRPASISDLYPLLQTALEEHPRRSPRVDVGIPARCTRADRRWMGAVVSLSAHGCLMRSSVPMTPAQELNLVFPLSRENMFSTRVKVLHQRGDQVGLEFCNPAPSARTALSKFIESRLTT
jgi:hypothetical protein